MVLFFYRDSMHRDHISSVVIEIRVLLIELVPKYGKK